MTKSSDKIWGINEVEQTVSSKRSTYYDGNHQIQITSLRKKKISNSYLKTLKENQEMHSV